MCAKNWDTWHYYWYLAILWEKTATKILYFQNFYSLFTVWFLTRLSVRTMWMTPKEEVKIKSINDFEQVLLKIFSLQKKLVYFSLFILFSFFFRFFTVSFLSTCSLKGGNDKLGLVPTAVICVIATNAKTEAATISIITLTTQMRNLIVIHMWWWFSWWKRGFS